MKVIVGMSGGVDSSVAALLLKQQGYDVTGLFMKNWEDDEDGVCQAENDYQDALGVCQRLNIPLKTINFSKDYMDKVFKIALEQFQQGLTPNPDILCNQEIKFKCFFDTCIEMGADFIATGHYANVTKKNDQYALERANDSNKDQTYFLYTLNQKILPKLLFPLGSLTKDKVRAIAKEHKLVNFNKKDSTGICFIGERDFKEFLSQYILKKPGDIISDKGDILGIHDGLSFYTIGQRSGLMLGGIKGYPEKPWYVVKKDLEKNQLVVAQDHNHPLLMKKELICINLNWITQPITQPTRCTAKIRYRQDDNACTIHPNDNNSAHVIFDKEERAITPGQAIVFYNGKICIGGGFIKEVIDS